MGIQVAGTAVPKPSFRVWHAKTQGENSLFLTIAAQADAQIGNTIGKNGQKSAWNGRCEICSVRY